MNELQTEVCLGEILPRLRYLLGCSVEDSIESKAAEAGLAIVQRTTVELLLKQLVFECAFDMKDYKALVDARAYLDRRNIVLPENKDAN